MPGYRWKLLRNGEFWLDAGCMFGLIPRVVWSRWLTPDDANRMPLQQNGLLLEGPAGPIVIEVGIGNKLGEKERAIYRQQERTVVDSLRELGFAPADIETVIVTHLHFDHAGGLTQRTPAGPHELTFPGARIIAQRREWEDAIANRSTMHKTYLRDHLTPEVADRMELVEGEREVLPGITVWPLPGHTWGQQGVRFSDESGQTIAFIPDVMPTAYHHAPTTNMAYDVEPYTSMLQREALLARAAEEHWILVINHDHGPAVYRAVAVAEKPGAYRLEPTGQAGG